MWCSYYQNPASLDSCEQFTERLVFSLQQLHPGHQVEKRGPTSFHLDGVTVTPQVVSGKDNSSGELAVLF